MGATRPAPLDTGVRSTKHRVLIVEDHRDTRELYADYFRACGWEVEEIANGEDAAGVAAAFLPGVIVMDIAMPGVDGLEATRRIRASSSAAREIPIVILSAYIERIYDALNAGCDDFLPRPCAPSRLLEAVRALLAQRKTGRRSKRGAVEPA